MFGHFITCMKELKGKSYLVKEIRFEKCLMSLFPSILLIFVVGIAFFSENFNKFFLLWLTIEGGPQGIL